MLFYFEVFGSYYQLYKLANNRDKLVNTFCVIHENRRANVVERAKGVYYIKPGINFPGLVLIPSIRQMQSGSFSPFTSVLYILN